MITRHFDERTGEVYDTNGIATVVVGYAATREEFERTAEAHGCTRADDGGWYYPES